MLGRYLNDIVGRHVKKEHVFSCIKNAKSGRIKGGCVGASTGMTSFGFKSGIGTSSRIVDILGKKYTIGVLVNNNTGNFEGHHKYLRMGTLPVGKLLHQKNKIPMQNKQSLKESSIIIVIATDIPLDHRQLNRLSRRAIMGMARVGMVSYTHSGEFIISFSTANKLPKRGNEKTINAKFIEETLLNPVFEAAIEATEEAIINSLLMAESMKGKKWTHNESYKY